MALSRWELVDLDNKIPNRPACYVMYLNGILSYIGQSVSLASRMSQHGVRSSYTNLFFKGNNGPFRVMVKANYGKKYGDWAMKELRLIKRIKPPLNRIGNSKRKAK